MNQHLRLPKPPQSDAPLVTHASWRDRLPPWMSFNRLLFLSLFLLPFTLMTTYMLAIASDRYVSEARFIVRGISNSNIGGLAVVFRAFGIANAKDDAFAVLEYLHSRDAVIDLSKRLPLAEMLNRPEADIWAGYGRVWPDTTVEALYRQYQRYVEVYYDPQTGITTLTVQSFRPEDSQAIAKELLLLGESLVNRMNNRAQADSISHAETTMRAAEERVIATQAALTEFRNREMMLDPGSQTGGTVQLITSLTAELASLRVLIQQTREKSPLNPNIPALEARAQALQRQIDERRSDIVGSDSSLANKIGNYERLVLEREFSERALVAATNAFENARQEARRQRIYIETVAFPHLPDTSTQPRRWRLIITTFLFGLMAYAMAWLLFVGAREHADFES
jgi:capsular polysaccharide transport system permease protein